MSSEVVGEETMVWRRVVRDLRSPFSEGMRERREVISTSRAESCSGVAASAGSWCRGLEIGIWDSKVELMAGNREGEVIPV